MKRIKLIISYLGDNYCGWQVQKNKRSVQSTLQDALQTLYGQRPPVIGCSRTDSKVHARNYVCCFDIEDELDSIPRERLAFALCSVLPDDISCKRAEYADADFHPRYSCLCKEYEYLIYNSPLPDVFLHNRAWHIKKKLDVAKMKEATKFIEGKKDFRAFMASGSDIADTVRDVKSIKITENNSLISIKISADGFLYNMVRIITGTLVDVAKGTISPQQTKDIIASLDRKNAGITAPAHGLYLNRIFYEKEDIL